MIVSLYYRREVPECHRQMMSHVGMAVKLCQKTNHGKLGRVIKACADIVAPSMRPTNATQARALLTAIV